MRLYRETALRKRADTPTTMMLDLWSSLSKKATGVSIEVMTGDRRQHPQLRSFSGQLHTAMPGVVQGKVALVLWLDSLTTVDFVVVTHEIGHWVIKLQGFRGMVYPKKKHCDTEILLNSLVHHPPVYALQKSLGHQPQEEIDSRTSHDINLFRGSGETSDQMIWTNNALLIADDLINCSKDKGAQLRGVVGERHPNTMRLAAHIIDMASQRNLLYPADNLEFQRTVLKELKLGEWREVDEVRELASMAKRNG